jgi:hypothetical protein
MKAQIGLTAAIAMFFGNNALARPIETAVVPGFSIRNGDWVVVDALGVVLLGLQEKPARGYAVVMRSELGIGGASAGVGPATNLFSGQGPRDMSDFLGSGILSLEARVTRMYGLTSWRSTTYVGGQLSFAGIIWKPAIGWMVAVDNPHDVHGQITLFGGGW